MDEAERCGRVALLDAGRLVALDTPEALDNAMPGRILAVQAPGLSRGALLAALARVDGATGPAQPYGSMAHLPASDPERAATAARAALAAAGATEVTVEPVAPSLEDVFIARASGRDSAAGAPPAAAADSAGAPVTRQPRETAIEVRDLTRRFGSFTAVDGVSFSVRRGEIFGFLGPNGSGKTTTIRMICGILPPSGGRAEVLGRDVARQPEAVRQEVGYMSQRFGLYGDLSAAQNLEFYGGMYGVTGRQLRQRRDELIAMAGLQGREKALAAELSGGWRQRLALGCALMHRPPVLLLDEPTGGVDPVSRRDFWDLIYQLAGDGATVLVTTHYMDEAEHCDRIALLHESRLIAVGAPAELKARFPGLLLEVKAAPLEVALRALDPWRPALYGTAMHLQVAGEADTERVRAALQTAGIGDARLTPIVPSLEDVFLALVAGQRTPESEPRGSGLQAVH
jgi:ABC-2 type transport system ATP-binding protein